MAQEDRGVAPPVWVPRLGRLGANLHAGQDKESYIEQQNCAADSANVAGIGTEMANERNVAYGASLGGICEAAHTWDALAGARADEDELGLQRLVPLLHRGARARAAGRRAGYAAE